MREPVAGAGLHLTVMERVLVIGSGGSGKTRLALELREILNVRAHHLDRLFWKPGWEPSTDREIESAVKKILDDDTWIMDGNYGGTMVERMDRADTIIFLDLPTLTCLRGVIARFFKYRNTNRPDMTEGNNERLTLDFLGWILSYKRTRRPKVLSLMSLHKHHKNVFILDSRKAVKAFLTWLRTEIAAAKRQSM